MAGVVFFAILVFLFPVLRIWGSFKLLKIGSVLNAVLLVVCGVWFWPDLAASPTLGLVSAERLADPAVRGLLAAVSVWTVCGAAMWTLLRWIAPRQASTI